LQVPDFDRQAQAQAHKFKGNNGVCVRQRHTHRQAETETQAQKTEDTDTDTDRDRQTDRQTERCVSNLKFGCTCVWSLRVSTCFIKYLYVCAAKVPASRLELP
jgi:hypothetical protein